MCELRTGANRPEYSGRRSYLAPLVGLEDAQSSSMKAAFEILF